MANEFEFEFESESEFEVYRLSVPSHSGFTRYMTSAGLLIMIASVGTVTLLFSWCVWKVMTTPDEAEKLHAVELITPDMHEE